MATGLPSRGRRNPLNQSGRALIGASRTLSFLPGGETLIGPAASVATFRTPGHRGPHGKYPVPGGCLGAQTGKPPMDLTQMYMTSPDWLKLLWTVLPHVTIWVISYQLFATSRRRDEQRREKHRQVRSKNLDNGLKGLIVEDYRRDDGALPPGWKELGL